MADAISDQFSNIKSMFGGKGTAGSPNLDPTTGNAGGNKVSRGAGAGIGFLAGGPVGAGIGALISPLFGSKGDASSYTGMGNNYQLGDMAYEGVGGDQDSLTQLMRSMTNYGAQRGQQLNNAGDQTYGLGMDVAGKGLSLYDQPVSYWASLLSGDPTETTKAMAPEAATIAQQFGQAQTSAERDMPMGGYRAGSVANMPFAQAAAVGNTALKLRPTAATAMSGMAKDITGAGTDISKLGLGEQGLGQETLANTLQSLLARRNENYQVDTSNRQALTSGLQALLAALV